MGACEKDYRDDRLVISRNFKCNDAARMLVGTVDRSVACKKVVKGKKFIKEQLIPSRFEEEIEWVCDEGLSLRSWCPTSKGGTSHNVVCNRNTIRSVPVHRVGTFTQ